jgi:hypothetical protein
MSSSNQKECLIENVKTQLGEVLVVCFAKIAKQDTANKDNATYEPSQPNVAVRSHTTKNWKCASKYQTNSYLNVLVVEPRYKY